MMTTTTPNNTQAERSLLGSILIDQDVLRAQRAMEDAVCVRVSKGLADHLQRIAQAAEITLLVVEPLAQVAPLQIGRAHV